MQKITRRQFMQISAVATVGAVMTACGKPTEAPTVAPTSKPAEPTTTPEPVKEMTWPREDVPRERTYIQMFQGSAGAYTDTGILGPWASGYNHQAGHAASLEALAYFSAHGNKEYLWLAESYEYNDDATELTIFIRKGAEWSDGVEFTATDVAFVINTLIAQAPLLRDSGAVKLLVKEAVIVDNYTVILFFNEPTYRFMQDFLTFRFDRGVYMVPEHIYKDVESDYTAFTFVDPDKDWPVVTAPYKITADEVNHKHFDLRYEWWAEKIGLAEMPAVERIIMIPYSEHEVAGQMIINNELDQGPEFPPGAIAAIIDQAPHIITHTGREAPYGYVDWWPLSVFFNTLEKPYDDRRVRWAMAYAIDQQQIVDVGQAGAGMPTAVPYPYFPPLMKYIDSIDDILEKYNPLERNPNKVDELMTDAGFTKDDEGFWADDEGNRPNSELYAPAVFFADTAPIITEQLRQGGFDAKHVSPPDVWTAVGDGRAYLHMFGHGGSIGDPYYTLEFYHSRNIRPTGENCGNNRPRWGDEELDGIIDEMSMTPTDDPKMMDLFRKGMEIWLRELPEVPIVQYYHRIPYNTTYW